MAFNSVVFIFVFAPLVCIPNFFLSPAWSNRLILIASLFFYGWGEPRFLFAIFASATFDYFLGAVIARNHGQAAARLALAVGVCANLGLLVYCKYAAFFLESLGQVFGNLGIPIPEVLLPLGLSFVVFEKITYLVDVYRKTTPPAQRYSDYLFFVFFFPKMLAGPIIKYHEINAQIQERRVALDDVIYGVSRFIVGLSKKVLVADSLAKTVEAVFSAPADQIGFGDAWLAALCFSVQIYFDFSGYSDMAIGLARILGFRLRENFNQPYLSVGFTEFWQRWHISLSTWIRDYLYIPLGGNRCGAFRVFVNLWICFLASGIWHGANWTFIVWGAYHGLFVWLDRVVLKDRIWRAMPRFLGVAVTFFLVTIGWVFFRARTLSNAASIVAALFKPTSTSSFQYLGPSNDVYIFLVLGLVCSFIPLLVVVGMTDRIRGFEVVKRVLILLLTIWSFGQVCVSTFTPFLYFRF